MPGGYGPIGWPPRHPRGNLIPQEHLLWQIRMWAPAVIVRNAQWVIENGDVRDLDFPFEFDRQIVMLQNHLAEQEAIIKRRLEQERAEVEEARAKAEERAREADKLLEEYENEHGEDPEEDK